MNKSEQSILASFLRSVFCRRQQRYVVHLSRGLCIGIASSRCYYGLPDGFVYWKARMTQAIVTDDTDKSWLQKIEAFEGIEI